MPLALCLVYDHRGNQTEWTKRIFAFRVCSSGLLLGRYSNDKHAAIKVHHYCDGCHLEVTVEKPAFLWLRAPDSSWAAARGGAALSRL